MSQLATRIIRKPSELDAPPFHARPSVHLDRAELAQRNAELLADLAREVQSIPPKPVPKGITFPAPIVRPKHEKKTLEQVCDACCTVCCVGMDQVRGSNRHKATVLCRRLIVVVARMHTVNSYPEINRAIRGGGQSHTTAVTAHGRFREDEKVMIWDVTRTCAAWVSLVERELGIKPQNTGERQNGEA
jgi:hypothetical protein